MMWNLCVLRNANIPGQCKTLLLLLLLLPITVAARSNNKAWIAFARSNTKLVGYNPTPGIDVCLRLFCVCVVSGLATGWSTIEIVLPTVLELRNWSETKSFADALCSKVGATGKTERYNLLTYLCTELSPSWKAANCAAIQEIPSNFKEPEGSSLCSQEPSTGP
jgi:hypothetical protein